ncbi:MAG: hypothetical protein R3B68_14940 [Phycisphaerales bacterium]
MRWCPGGAAMGGLMGGLMGGPMGGPMGVASVVFGGGAYDCGVPG